jgi:glycosyltransferase involved in cell wall biosynthesis
MASGAPVVASAHPSMDEAAGDAAVRADPEVPQAIAKAIRDAVSQRQQLREKGILHAKRFSWRRVGEIFLDGYERFA